MIYYQLLSEVLIRNENIGNINKPLLFYDIKVKNNDIWDAF